MTFSAENIARTKIWKCRDRALSFAEETMIIQEMYEKAAEQLIRKLPSVHTASKDADVPVTTPDVAPSAPTSLGN